MTRDEAIATLQRFGEGIHPTRDLYESDPNHDDYHNAIGTLCELPWANYGWARHLEHHKECATILGARPPDEAADHSDHSNDLLVAASRYALTPQEAQ